MNLIDQILLEQRGIDASSALAKKTLNSMFSSEPFNRTTNVQPLLAKKHDFIGNRT